MYPFPIAAKIAGLGQKVGLLQPESQNRCQFALSSEYLIIFV